MVREITNERTYSTKARALGGAVAGIIAGIVMAMVAMINAATSGLEFLFPVKQIAAFFYGVDALIAGADAVIVGLLIHVVTSAVAGLIFGLFVGGRLNALLTLFAGLVYGAAIWAIMTWLVLPWANEVMFERVMVIPTWWFAYHLVFGAMLVLTPVLVDAFATKREVHYPTTEPQLRTQST